MCRSHTERSNVNKNMSFSCDSNLIDPYLKISSACLSKIVLIQQEAAVSFALNANKMTCFHGRVAFSEFQLLLLNKSPNDNIEADNTIKIILNVIHNTTLSGWWNTFKIEITHSMVN